MLKAKSKFFIIFMKRIVQDIGAKAQIMELMSHSDNDVRYQALMAVQ
jgi:V-type H+-transporting ATPase subunit H